MNENDSAGAFFAGFLLGALVGAAAALLLTPQSGEKTRLLLQEKSIELKTQVEEKLPAKPAAEVPDEGSATEAAGETDA
jgi:gas vesicle protein